MKKAIWLATCLLSAPALAVSTSTWKQSNQEDYKKGVLENVVATNLGDLKLSRAVSTLLEQDPRVSSVNALAEGPDGTIYAATGPQGVLLAIKDQNVSTVATIDGSTNLTALIADHSGKLLIGTAGDKGRVLAIDKPGDNPRTIFQADGVQYVWALAQTPDGNVYAATGPTGKLFEIHPDGSHKVLLDSGENNLLSLVSDGNDLLYAGTDPHGLVYRVNRKTGKSFVLYNAPENEIGALALDRKGNLYAATSEAREERFAPGENANAQQVHGRPEGGETGLPIPSENPKEPSPPKLPEPNPGEPHPIPKHVEKTSLLGSGLQHRVFLLADNVPGAQADDDAGLPQPTPPNPGRPRPPGPPAATPGGEAEGPAVNRQPTVNTANSGEPRPQGNAVYKIDPQGFVTEIFRQPVLVLAMVEHQGTILIATGSEGEIYQVNPAADETVMLAKVDPKQVTCLLPASDGNIYMGMANVGGIASMSSGYATSGTYTSPVMDETPAEEFLRIKSPPARFLQYRFTFSSPQGAESPVVDDVTVAYQIPNLPPQVKSIRVANAAPNPDGQGGGNSPSQGENELRRVQPSPRQTIAWDASDANNDALQYTLYFRRTPGGPWILLKDKLTDAQFDWDTRTVADGRYQVKVVASDANANPPGQGRTASRVSDTFT